MARCDGYKARNDEIHDNVSASGKRNVVYDVIRPKVSDDALERERA
jgi:hypothetical protein